MEQGLFKDRTYLTAGMDSSSTEMIVICVFDHLNYEFSDFLTIVQIIYFTFVHSSRHPCLPKSLQTFPQRCAFTIHLKGAIQ
jgi:hypothetical protein